MNRLALRNPRSRAGRRARYWALRAVEKRAVGEAQKRAVELFKEQPLDWYGIQLLHRYPDVLGDGGQLRLPAAPVKLRAQRGFTAQSREVKLLAKIGALDFSRRALEHLAPRLRAADRWPLEAHLASNVGDAERLYVGTLTEHNPLMRVGRLDLKTGGFGPLHILGDSSNGWSRPLASTVFMRLCCKVSFVKNPHSTPMH